MCVVPFFIILLVVFPTTVSVLKQDKRCTAFLCYDKEVPAVLVQSAIMKTKVKPRPSPSVFYFPGLNSKPIFDPSDFEFTKTLNENHDLILNECSSMIKDRDIQSDYLLRPDEHQLHEGEWLWASYILKGKRQNNFRSMFPGTAKSLDSIQRLMTSIPFGSAFFSTLMPNSRIKPHHGPCNLRIRCHYPLIVPTGGKCGMRVADEVISWKVGEPLIFDDCYEHEVWNDSNEPRVVLLFS